MTMFYLIIFILSVNTFYLYIGVECVYSCPNDHAFSKPNNSCISCYSLCKTYNPVQIIIHGHGCKLTENCIRRYRHFVVRKCGQRFVYDPHLGICDSCEKACYDFSLYSPEDCIILCNISVLTSTLPSFLQTGVMHMDNDLHLNMPTSNRKNLYLTMMLLVGVLLVCGIIVTITILKLRNKKRCTFHTKGINSQNSPKPGSSSPYISMKKIRSQSIADSNHPKSASVEYRNNGSELVKEYSTSCNKPGYSFIVENDSFPQLKQHSFSYHRIPGDMSWASGVDGSEYDFRSDISHSSLHIETSARTNNARRPLDQIHDNTAFKPQHADQDSIGKLPANMPEITDIKQKFTRLARNDWIKRILSNGRFVRVVYDAMDQVNADRLVREQTGLRPNQFECVYAE